MLELLRDYETASVVESFRFLASNSGFQALNYFSCLQFWVQVHDLDNTFREFTFVIHDLIKFFFFFLH